MSSTNKYIKVYPTQANQVFISAQNEDGTYKLEEKNMLELSKLMADYLGPRLYLHGKAIFSGGSGDFTPVDVQQENPYSTLTMTKTGTGTYEIQLGSQDLGLYQLDETTFRHTFDAAAGAIRWYLASLTFSG